MTRNEKNDDKKVKPEMWKIHNNPEPSANPKSLKQKHS